MRGFVMACSLLLAGWAGNVLGETAAESSVGTYIIYDSSGSMWGELSDGSRKYEAARTALSDFLAQDFAGRNLALRIYGHRKKDDCTDSALEVGFTPAAEAGPQINGALQGIRPLGRTPIHLSLSQALADFGDRTGDIILISDGIESCNQDPCALVKEWAEKNIAIRVHVVGFGLTEKEKPALQCIADAAGTTFIDADSASALTEGLADIKVRQTRTTLAVRGILPDGTKARIDAEITKPDGEVEMQGSRARIDVEPGLHKVRVGVLTRDGSIYAPVPQEVEAVEFQETKVVVEVPLPPSVSARFEGQMVTAAPVISAYQDGKRAYKFRAQDRPYVQPGTYEFRASPKGVGELSVTATLVPGEHTELVFEVPLRVKVHYKMLASLDEARYAINPALWKDGALAFKLHTGNDRVVEPGEYELRLDNGIVYFATPVSISEEPVQHNTIIVPSAALTVIYQTADGTPEEKSKRVFHQRADGTYSKTFSSMTPLYLTPGRYKITGWGGTYEDQIIDLEADERRTLILRDQSETQ